MLNRERISVSYTTDDHLSSRVQLLPCVGCIPLNCRFLRWHSLSGVDQTHPSSARWKRNPHAPYQTQVPCETSRGKQPNALQTRDWKKSLPSALSMRGIQEKTSRRTENARLCKRTFVQTRVLERAFVSKRAFENNSAIQSGPTPAMCGVHLQQLSLIHI